MQEQYLNNSNFVGTRCFVWKWSRGRIKRWKAKNDSFIHRDLYHSLSFIPLREMSV